MWELELVQKASQFFLLTVIFLNDIGCVFFLFLWDFILWSVSCNEFIAIIRGNIWIRGHIIICCEETYALHGTSLSLFSHFIRLATRTAISAACLRIRV